MMTRIIKPNLSYIIILLITQLITQCKVKDYEVVFNNRNKEPTATESNLDKVYKDSLMVFFEQGFNQTLVKVKTGKRKVFESEVTTHDDIELAEVINIGYNKKVEDFSVSINNGKYILIKVDFPYKYVAINYFIDTVRVDYLKSYPMYE